MYEILLLGIETGVKTKFCCWEENKTRQLRDQLYVIEMDFCIFKISI